MKEEIVDRIAIQRGLRKIGVSSCPTWVDKNNQEGIELKAGVLRSFWFIDGTRNYDEPATNKIDTTIEMIKKESNGNEKTTLEGDKGKADNPKIPESKEVKEQDNKLVVADNAQLPDFLTPALMSKWAEMSTTDRILLFQKTPKEQVYDVVVGKNDKGKEITAPYVKGNYMIKEANASFLFDWYLDIKEVSTSQTGVSVRGTLYAYFKEYNKYISRPATGYQEINKKVDAQQAQKGATTDAIKKGLSLFGFNSDVYSGEV